MMPTVIASTARASSIPAAVAPQRSATRLSRSRRCSTSKPLSPAVSRNSAIWASLNGVSEWSSQPIVVVVQPCC